MLKAVISIPDSFIISLDLRTYYICISKNSNGVLRAFSKVKKGNREVIIFWNFASKGVFLKAVLNSFIKGALKFFVIISCLLLLIKS